MLMEQQIIAAWAQVGAMLTVGGLQCYLIVRGLNQMGKASEARNRQLDIMEAASREQSQALRQQGEALGKIGEEMTKAFTQQGEVLAELLRRSPA